MTNEIEERLRAFVDDLRACQHDIEFTRSMEATGPNASLAKRVDEIAARAHGIWLNELGKHTLEPGRRDEALEPIMLLKAEIQNLVVACRRALGDNT